MTYRDPDLESEIGRLRCENAALRKALDVAVRPKDDLLPWQSACPGCFGTRGIRLWVAGSIHGHFACKCGDPDNDVDTCGCEWKEMTAADTDEKKVAESRSKRERTESSIVPEQQIALSETNREIRLLSERMERDHRRLTACFVGIVMTIAAVAGTFILKFFER